MELVIECCPHCGGEANLLWDIAVDGYYAHCPYCGNRLMLCSECPATRGRTNCDYDSETGRCKMMPKDSVYEVIEDIVKDFDIEITIGGKSDE